MRTAVVTFVAVALVAFQIGTANGKGAKKAKRVNVLQLFLSVPSGLLGFHQDDGKLEPIEKRKSRIKLTDVKNGYLEVDPRGLEAFESDIQVAYFRRPSSVPLLLLSFELGDSTDDLLALEKRDGKWRDVTREVIPKVTAEFVNARTHARVPEARKKNLNLDDCASGTFRYLLPRHGRTILAKTRTDCLTVGNGKIIFKLVPDGEKFKIVE
jgi:hypothetical protein